MLCSQQRHSVFSSTHSSVIKQCKKCWRAVGLDALALKGNIEMEMLPFKFTSLRTCFCSCFCSISRYILLYNAQVGLSSQQAGLNQIHSEPAWWEPCNTKQFMDLRACHVSVVAFVMLCCSAASPVIMLRGLAGNKAAALLWGCCAWLWMSRTILHKQKGSTTKWWFPGCTGSLLLDNVVMKGDRKDSGSGTKPGQLVRAGE